MGNSFSSLFDYFFGKEEVRILMIGLDAAGKTTILYQLKLGEVISTIPTIGFNVDTVEYKNIIFTVWDVGGQKRIRSMWRYYFTYTAAIVYVVDASDVERMPEAAEELREVMSDDTLRDAVVVVFANKQDLPGALTPSQLADRMDLKNLKHQWHVHGACATTGQGLYEGLDVLRDMLRERKRLMRDCY